MQILTHDQLVAQLIQYAITLAPEITDWTVGAPQRALFEANAAVIQKEQVRVQQAVLAAIRISAFRAFGFSKLQPTPATGFVAVTRASSVGEVTIPVGSVFSVPGSSIKSYTSLAAVTMANGVGSAEVAVRCLTTGTVGRTAANTIVSIISSLGFAATCTNTRAVLNGTDEETDNDQAARFALFIGSLSGGTKLAVLYAAQQVALYDVNGAITEKVAAAVVREPFKDDAPPGHLGLVQVYIDNGSGTASAALIARTLLVLTGYEESGQLIGSRGAVAGIDLEVYGASPLIVNIEATIEVRSGYDTAAVKTLVENALTNYLRGLPVFAEVIHAELVSAAIRQPGVSDVSIIVPSGNVAASVTSRAVPGSLMVTVV